MKSFNIIFTVVLFLIAAVFAGTNIYFLNEDNSGGREYRVQVERACNEIEKDGAKNINLSDYPLLVAIEKKGETDDKAFFKGNNADYLIREIGGDFYRFDYRTNYTINSNTAAAANISLGILSTLIIAVLIFIKRNILHPFEQLKNVPYELSKGNLVLPLKESRSRFFGRFVWGMDLLRENLEQQKENELRLQKEKKTLILSLSHDIKTPLSAIKLYSKALSKNIYGSPQKNAEIAENIDRKADEIDAFVSQIIKASGEDFLHLTVQNEEFYMSEIIEQIAVYYSDKLSLVKTGFTVEKYPDCILKGDAERAVEVLQNIMENAIKYGDGQFIRIAFSDEEDCRLIAISNSGCTLSANELPHIFDSFWRGSNTAGKSGSGLGLFICRQLMNKMDGEIFAESRNNVMTVTVVFRKA